MIAQSIHLIVTPQNALRQILIAANQRVQAVANHGFGQFAHPRQIHVRLDLWMTKNAHRGLRDVHRLVADALQISIDSRYGEQQPQIRSHGLIQGEQALHALVNFDLHFVDRVFFGEHGFRQMFFGVQHSVHGLMHGAFSKAPHPQQPLFQFIEIVFEMSFHGSSVCKDTQTIPSHELRY